MKWRRKKETGLKNNLINGRTRVLSQEDIDKITRIYNILRNIGSRYEDIPGFCASASLSKVAELDYVLTTGLHLGLPDD